MGFSINYELTEPVTPETEAALQGALASLRSGRTWLECEPPLLFETDGVLSGASKPNFQPDPDDAASARLSGEPGGTLNDLLDILCELSRRFDVDWEISHDYSDGPVGYIRKGEPDDDLQEQCAILSDLGAELSGDGFDVDDLDLDDL